MNLSPQWHNFVNRIPKLLLLLVVFYALAQNREMLFGRALDSDNQNNPVRIDTALVSQFFHQPTLLTTTDSVLYEVRFAATHEDPDGYVIVEREATNSAWGHDGPVSVAVFLDDGMIIRGVHLLEEHETRRFVERMQTARFLERWNGRHLYDPQQPIDATTGATATSVAVATNVNRTLAALLDRTPAPVMVRETPHTMAGQWAVLFVTVMSLACFFAPDTTRRLRIPLLILSVAVLGIWQGTFLSMAGLYRWLIMGFPPLAYFGVFIILLLSFLLPLFTGRGFYCRYLCPFGAAQELVGVLTRRKLKLSPQTLTVARWVRRGILVTVVILLLILPHVELADLEPFTLFLFRSAALSSLVLAGLSLVGSLFVRRPWCRLLCPTGEILSLLRRKVRYPRFLSRHHRA
ncbi:MAG TPA: 4Fe-4S binding protein [Candidatus Rikenella faecigallinarum]|uniref:4Fe-4S binding protein n=1 Tax=Candidatus Rikenella faecigallinarum TaxID=2838745 RepID=A0A9D1QAZ9_9BACT|nr:4Fe-4S binding protein [Candidatus Rikenella faecigallinarum]